MKFEEKKIINRDSKLQFQDGPALTWELTNFWDNYYKESEPFIIDGHPFILKIQYSIESLQLKISSIDVNNAHTSLNLSGIPSDFLQSYNFNASNILSAMYQIEIGSYRMPQAGVSSFIEDGMSSLELINISDFKYEKYLDHTNVMKIQLFFKLKYTHSSILSQLGKNFNFYHTDKAIKLLSPAHLWLLYSYDYLEVMSEDQVLVSFINWFIDNNQEVDSPTVNNIIDQIRWNHVTMKTLHKWVVKHKTIRENSDMRRIFKNELERRIREQLQDREATCLYGVYLQKREARKSYVNFLRPETATNLFEFLYTKLLEVDTDNNDNSVDGRTEDPVRMSRNVSITEAWGSSKLSKSRSEVDYSKLAKHRLRDARRQNNFDGGVAINNEEDDDNSDDGGMQNMLNKLTPITDSRKGKMNQLFNDWECEENKDATENEYHIRSGIKQISDMQSYDVPNWTNGDDSNKGSFIKNQKAGSYFNALESGNESSDTRERKLFMGKAF